MKSPRRSGHGPLPFGRALQRLPHGARLVLDTFGFLRVAAVAPKVHLADPLGNAEEIAEWARSSRRRPSLRHRLPRARTHRLHVRGPVPLGGPHAPHRAGHRRVVPAPPQTSPRPSSSRAAAALDGRRYNTAVVIPAVVFTVPCRNSICPTTASSTSAGGSRPAARRRRDLRLACAVSDVAERPDVRFGPITLGIEICEDLWAPEPPSGALALAGANVIVNPSASNELVAKAEYRRALVVAAVSPHSRRLRVCRQQGQPSRRKTWCSVATVSIERERHGARPRASDSCSTDRRAIADIDLEQLGERTGPQHHLVDGIRAAG